MAFAGEDIQPLRSVSRRPLQRQPLQVPSEVGVHRASNMEMGGLVTLPTPRILGGPEVPRSGSLSPWASAQWAWEGRREGRRPRLPLAPVPCCAHSPLPSTLHPSHLMLSCTLHHCSLGSKWFPLWPHPHPGGGRGRAGTWPPASLSLPPSHHVSSVPVCVPRLLSAASLLLVPLSTLQPFSLVSN